MLLKSLFKSQRSYKSQFEKACRFTRKLGLDSPQPKWIQGQNFNPFGDERLMSIVQPFFGKLNPEEVALQCIQISEDIRPKIEKAYGIKTWLTFGFLTVNDVDYFKFSKGDVHSWISDGVDLSNAELHAWLTAETGEILDFTFLTSWGLVNNKKEAIGLIVCGREEILEHYTYHPIAVERSFAEKIGAWASISFPI